MHRFTPELRGAVVPETRDRGCWEEVEGLLGKLGMDIVLGADANVTADVLTAIPTPWARPIIFAQALVDVREPAERDLQHPLHNEVLQEWRGLLAMFCFQDQYGLALSSKVLELDDPRVADTSLGRTLADLLPSPAWKRIHLIYSGGKLIAGTSPLSLFFTAPSYQAPVPWRDRETRRLVDPMSFFRGDFDQWKGCIQRLYTWVSSAIDSLGTIVLPDDDSNNTNRNRLADLLTTWRAEIRAVLGGDMANQPAAELPRTNPVVSDSPYDRFCWGYRSREFISNCLLATDKVQHRTPVDIPVVLMSDLRSARGGLVVDGAHTIADIIQPAGATGDELQTNTGLRITRKWINPEKLFTERVLSIPLSENALTGGGRDLVLPFNKEIFDYFTIEELSEYFSWQAVGDSFLAKLQVPLGGTGSTKRELVTAQREYRGDQIVSFPNARTPILALWPNFRAYNWQHNYCYCWLDEETAKSLSMKPIVDTTAKTEEAGRPGNPWEGKVWRTDEFTAGFECTYQEGVNSQVVGVVVPKPQRFKMVNDAGKMWKVGLDFGTSNTTIAYSAGDAEPAQVKFEDRVVILTRPEEAQAKETYIKPAFMPTGTREWPPINPSAIVSSTCVAYHAIRDPKPVLDIAFLPLDCTPGFATYLWLSQTADVKAGLKWATDPAIRTLIDGFLRHILLLVAAEARAQGVTEMSIHWSFPSAMPEGMQHDLEGKWQAIINSIDATTTDVAFPKTGITIKRSDCKRTTESEAVCRYFVKMHPDRARLGGNMLVTMDVGGGTTDIAVWQNGELRIQSSVLLSAGVVSKLLANDGDGFKELIEDILGLRWEEYSSLWEHPEKSTRIAAALNLILRRHRDKAIEALKNHGEEKRSVAYRLRSLVFFTFAAMIYFTGLCLKKVAIDLKLKEGPVEMFLGGNGARMLDIVGVGGTVRSALRTILIEAAGPEFAVKNLLINYSKNFKQEAAFGLLLEPVVDKTTAGSMLIGETGYQYVTAGLGWDMDLKDRANSSILEDRGAIVVPDDFPELNKFLSCYDRVASEKFSLPQLAGVYSPASVKAAVQSKLNQPKEPLGPLFVEEVLAVIQDRLLGARHNSTGDDQDRR